MSEQKNIPPAPQLMKKNHGQVQTHGPSAGPSTLFFTTYYASPAPTARQVRISRTNPTSRDDRYHNRLLHGRENRPLADQLRETQKRLVAIQSKQLQKHFGILLASFVMTTLWMSFFMNIALGYKNTNITLCITYGVLSLIPVECNAILVLITIISIDIENQRIRRMSPSDSLT